MEAQLEQSPLEAKKAVFRGDLNTKLSKMSKEEAEEAFQALRVIRDDSPMTNTTVFEKLSGGQGVVANTCWDSSCTYPLCTLQIIEKIGVEIMSLTQEMVIIEASGSELEYLGTGVIFLEAEVLWPARKKIEVAIIKGYERMV